MVCVEHETLRREWIAARADYQIALADLQVSSGADEFREALHRANKAFGELDEAEHRLDAHLKWHGCSRIPTLSSFPHTLRRVAS